MKYSLELSAAVMPIKRKAITTFVNIFARDWRTTYEEVLQKRDLKTSIFIPETRRCSLQRLQQSLTLYMQTHYYQSRFSLLA